MLDYSNKSEKEIITHAKGLISLSIRDIINELDVSINIKDKGTIGKLIEEYWFGMKLNNSSKPDFESAGIELKIIPLVKNTKKELKVKERTKICSINYNGLIKENWQDSHAKEKLNKILFIYYEYNKDILSSVVKKIDLWVLDNQNESNIIKMDWLQVHHFVENGKAHELSETLCNILAPSRSGSGGIDKKTGKQKDLVKQPNVIYEEFALKRAFSLKSSFTNQRWNEINKKKFESILDNNNTPINKFEEIILQKLNKLDKLTLKDVAKRFNINMSNGKNAAATIVKKALGFKNVNARIKEFEQFGIQVKVIPVRPDDFKPWEAVSFPAFKLKELIEEKFYAGETEDKTWDDCSLLNEINRILFIPVFRNKREGVPLEERKIGKPFFWSPSESELEIIQQEWENYIQEILDGKVEVDIKKIKGGYQEISKLSKESDTKIIHIRPHGKNRKDRDIDHLGNSIVKQSFWLNKNFLQKLVKQAYKN